MGALRIMQLYSAKNLLKNLAAFIHGVSDLLVRFILTQCVH